MRALISGLTLITIGLVAACSTSEAASPPPTDDRSTSTSSATTPTGQPTPPPTMPPLPKVAHANATIVKEPPPPPCGAGVDACIDLSANRSWLIQDGKITYGPVPITSGRAGYRTPAGTFKVGWKDIDHRSRAFDNAPMPFSVFFNGGIAFHEGSLSQESHGCIHLGGDAARTYYNALEVGDTVQVVS